MPERGHRRSDFHAGRSGTRRSCQFARNTRFLSFILNHFLRASGPGDTLYAEHANGIRPKHRLLSSDITNQNGDLIATFESSVFRKDQKVPFTL